MLHSLRALHVVKVVYMNKALYSKSASNNNYRISLAYMKMYHQYNPSSFGISIKH